MRQAVFELKKNAVDRYYFVFRKLDDAVIITSKSFKDRASIEKLIASVREAVRTAMVNGMQQEMRLPFFSIRQENSGYVFNLFGPDGEMMISSSCYAEKKLCADMLHSFLELAAEAKIIDMT